MVDKVKDYVKTKQALSVLPRRGCRKEVPRFLHCLLLRGMQVEH